MAALARSFLALGLALAGTGLLVLLSRQDPAAGRKRGPEGEGRSAWSGQEPPGERPEDALPWEILESLEAPGPLEGIRILLVAPGRGVPHPGGIVLGAEGGWRQAAGGVPPPATPAAWEAHGPPPPPLGGGLVVELPADLTALSPGARGALVAFLEAAAASVASPIRVHLDPDATAGERTELARLLTWVR